MSWQDAPELSARGYIPTTVNNIFQRRSTMGKLDDNLHDTMVQI